MNPRQRKATALAVATAVSGLVFGWSGVEREDRGLAVIVTLAAVTVGCTTGCLFLWIENRHRNRQPESRSSQAWSSIGLVIGVALGMFVLSALTGLVLLAVMASLASVLTTVIIGLIPKLNVDD